MGSRIPSFLKSTPIDLVGFFISSLIYAASSYLLLLRDAFKLERLALALNLPWIESSGLKLAGYLHVNLSSTLFLTASILGLFYFYFKITSKSKLPATTQPIFIASICCFLLSFPILSTDIFDYNNVNRVAFVHHANPWITPANFFPNDPRIYLGSWITRPTVYPYVSIFFFALVHFTFSQQIILNLLGFKIIGFIFFLASTQLLSQNTKASKLNLFVLNPLVLIEFLGHAHNDLLVGFFTLVVILFLSRRPVLAGLAWAAAFLSKFTALIYLPLILIYLANKKQFRPLANFLVTAFFLSVGTLAFMYSSTLPLLKNLATQNDYLLRSLPFAVRHLISLVYPFIFFEQSLFAEKIVTSIIFIISALILFTKLKRMTLPDATVVLFMLYLFISSPMVQPWYLGWFLPLLPLVTKAGIKASLLTLSFSASCYYVIEQTSLYFFPLHPAWQIIMYLFIAIPPLLVLALPQNWYTRYVKK